MEESVRIDAIVFLTQSNDVYVSPLGHGHAAVAIAQSAEQLTGPQRSHHTCDNLTRDNRVRRFEMACDLALALPVLDLRLNMTDDFWGPLQEALNSPGSQGSSPK